MPQQHNLTSLLFDVKIKEKTYTLHFSRGDFADAEWSLREPIISRPDFLEQAASFERANRVPPLKWLETMLFVGLQRYIGGELLPFPQPKIRRVIEGKEFYVDGPPENPISGFTFRQLRDYTADIPDDELFLQVLEPLYKAFMGAMPPASADSAEEVTPASAVPLPQSDGGSAPGPSVDMISDLLNPNPGN